MVGRTELKIGNLIQEPVGDTGLKSAVIYARFSSDLQNTKSINDQIFSFRGLLRDAERLLHTFEDHALSGTHLVNRPGVVALQEVLLAGEVDIVLCESLDRLSRSMEDTARLFNIAEFRNARIRTVVEGEITPYHVGIAGLVSSMEVAKISERTTAVREALPSAGPSDWRQGLRIRSRPHWSRRTDSHRLQKNQRRTGWRVAQNIRPVCGWNEAPRHRAKAEQRAKILCDGVGWFALL